MKLITAIVKPFKLDDVKNALELIGIAGLTVSEVQGFGRQRGPHRGLPRCGVPGGLRAEGPHRGRRRANSTPPASSTPSSRPPRTGQIGDGKVWVTTIDEIVRVRTGERGDDAL